MKPLTESSLLGFLPNRVRRNYTGGAGIDRLRQAGECRDGGMPEDWIASLVAARNPGLPEMAGEGMSLVVDASGFPRSFADTLAARPEFHLGAGYFRNNGLSLGFLAKLLDSSIRLHVQAHPTKSYAQKHLGSPWGKFECYYILGVRPGHQAYIRLGFQRSPGMAGWRRIIEDQDIAAMDACFEPIPVAPGEVWFVPGGLPHAIGPGLVMIEVMEPSDLVVRCEFEREGLVVPPEARFMGRGLEACLDMFDYASYPPAEVRRRFSCQAREISRSAGAGWDRLLDGLSNGSFELRRLRLDGACAMPRDGSFHVGIVTRGAVRVSSRDEAIEVAAGGSYFASAGGPDCGFHSVGGPAELCVIQARAGQGADGSRTLVS